MATQSSIFTCGIPWTEEPDGLQFTGSQRVGHDLATEYHHQNPFYRSQTEAREGKWNNLFKMSEDLGAGMQVSCGLVLSGVLPWAHKDGGGEAGVGEGHSWWVRSEGTYFSTGRNKEGVEFNEAIWK